MRRAGRLYVLLVLTAAAALPAAATHPLLDRIVVDDRQGEVFPEACCWMPMPKSERLRELRRAQRCSAIGGPVGRFRLQADQMLLDGFVTCSGDLPLQTVYPDAPTPMPATWLDGRFTIVLTSRCGSGEPMGGDERINLRLVQGRVVERTVQPAAETKCAGSPLPVEREVRSLSQGRGAG